MENGLRKRLARMLAAVTGVLLLSFYRPSHCQSEPAELPEAGGLESLPVRRAEPVTLENPDFEKGLEGWHRSGNGSFQAAEAAGRAGTSGLRFDAGAPSRYVPSARQTLKGIRPGIYTLSFWVRTHQLQPPQRGRGGVRASLEYHLESGTRQWPSTEVFSGTADWRPVKLRVLVPRGLRGETATISVHRYGTPRAGEAFLDDFSMERALEPAVEVFLLYPNYRGYLPEDGPQQIRMWYRINQPGPAGPAQLEARSATSGQRLVTVGMNSGKREGVIEIDAGKWPTGKYAIRASLGDYEYPTYFVQKIPAGVRERFGAWFNKDGVLSLQGEPVFPIGFYNTIMKFPTVDESEIQRLDKLSEAPANFTINYTWWPNPMKTRRYYLSEMQKRGIWYLDTLMPFKPGTLRIPPDAFPIGKELLPGGKGKPETQEEFDEFLAALARGMRKLPGHGGWYVMDERPFSMIPAIFRQYAVLRGADPDHPTFGVSNRASELYLWRDALDVFGMDPYPLFNMKLGRPLSLVGRETRVCMEATQHSRPVWMVLQFFQGWSSDRWPTEEELRTMSLMAITEGARGLFYWSFGMRALAWVKDPAQREDYWQRAVRVTKEIQSLGPALVSPDAPEVVRSVSDRRVRWRARSADGKWFVFAYLPADKFGERAESGPTKVTFTLNDGQEVRKEFRPDSADWFSAEPMR